MAWLIPPSHVCLVALSKKTWMSGTRLVLGPARGRTRVPGMTASETHSTNSTGVPLLTIRASARASQLVSRTQPFDAVLLTVAGSGVPWMP
jgi:hypothetical protein